MKIRTLGLVLVFCMIFALLPANALAAEAPTALEDNSTGDTSMGGLITKIPESMTVSWKQSPKKSSNKWEIATFQHDGHPVLQSTGEKGNSTVYSSFAFQPSSPSYVVFDYAVSRSKSSQFKIQTIKNMTSAYTAGNSATHNFTVQYDTCEKTDDLTWYTVVVQCSNTFPAIYLEHDLNKNDDNTLHKAYISNVRIYESVDELPDDYKVKVQISYNSEHISEVQYTTATNAKETSEKADIVATEEHTFPLFTKISFYLATTEGVEIESVVATVAGTSDKSDLTKSTGAYPLKLEKSGTYQIEVKSYKYPLNLTLSHSDDGDKWTNDTFVGNENLMLNNSKVYTLRQNYSTETSRQYKFNLTGMPLDGDTLTITDNGNPIERDDDGSFVITPGTQAHDVIIKLEEPGHETTQAEFILWPTLDWHQAFGLKSEDITTNFDSSAKPKEVLFEEKPGNTFYYAPDNAEDGYQYVFKSIPGDSTSQTVSEIQFKAEKGGLLIFDYMIDPGDYTIADYTFYVEYVGEQNYENRFVNIPSADGPVEWRHIEIPMEVGKMLRIHFVDKMPKADSYAAVSNLTYNTTQYNVKIEASGGSVTVNGKAPTESDQYFIGASLSLVPTPNSGYIFAGWYQGETLLSTDSVWTYKVSGEATITAKFIQANNQVAQVGDQVFSTLEEAVNAAKDGSVKQVRLLNEAYKLEKDLTIPAGVMLLLPCSDIDTGYSPVTGFNPDGTSTSSRTGATGTNYFNLTIPSGVTLTVEGTVLVNAVTGRPAQGHWDMDVNGGWAQITLDGNIVVKSGGVLDVCGYVRSSASGNGTVTAESGGEVRDLYVVRNWRGGSQAFHIFPHIYPMNEVDMHNIEVKTVINAGASFVGTVKMYASGIYYYTHFPQVDQENGLIQQTSGTVTRTYDTQSKRETWVLDGEGTISSSILPIVGMNLSTGTFLYPIDGDMDFVVKGNWNVVERLKFMPGAKVDLTEGTLTLAEKTVREPRGNEIVFYPDFQTADPNNTDNTQYPSDRGHAQMTIHGGTTTNVNSAFGGEVVVDKDAAPANPAVIKFMEGKAVSVTSKEANGYYSADLAKTQGTMRELTFKATLGGYTVESGKTYSCYYENDKLVIEVIGETATQEAVYSGQAVTWSGAGEVEYLVGGTWGDTAPTDAGEYPVRKSLDGGTDSYKLVERVGTIDIAPKAAQFALEPASGFTYDGTPKTVTVKVTNAAEGDTVTPVVTGDTTGTDTGEYTVTVTGLEGADKDNYTIDGATTTLTWNIAPKKEDAPTGLGFEYAGNITGLTAGQKYKVNGTEVTADAEGKTAIQDGWFGTTVSVVKSGDGKNTADSDGTALEIPARPAAPEVSTTQTSSSTAEDGSITVKIAEGETYEYRKSGEESWSDVPEGGKLEKLAAGSYEVRVKGTDSTFPGAVKTVTVTYYTPAPSTPSTSTTTTTNPDGSTTKTTTKADGTKTETTTKTDGTVTEKVTQKDGSATEKTTTPEGVTGQVETNAKGEVTSAEVVIPKNEETEKKDVVTAPVEVPAAKSAEEAPEISVKTGSADSTKVEIPVTEFGPGTVAVVVHPDGTEEIVRDCVIGENGVVLNVEGDVTLKIVDNTQTFADVEPVDHWAASAVEFVAARQLFNGTDVNEFTPDGDMKRGMLVTVLYRLTYEPEAGDAAFTDVDSNAYYADAVAWAESNGVVNGYGNTFAPEDNVTREQLVTILYRYANKTGGDTGKTGTLEGYADAAQVSDYARDAMAWAVSIGLVNGVDASHLAPSDSATRAEVATILMRFCEKVM